LGNKNFSSGNYDEAIVHYTKAIELNPIAIYYANRAAAYAAQGNMEKSLADCNKAIEKDPNYPKAYYRRGTALLALGKVLQAEMDFKKVSELEPKNTAAKEQIRHCVNIRQLLERGAQAIQGENWATALSAYNEVRSSCTHAVEPQLGIADAFIGLKNYADANSIATKILQKDDENTHALLIRGTAMYYMGQLPAAAKLLGNILQLDPDNTKAQRLWRASRKIETLKEDGNKEFREGKHELAVKIWTDALQEDPLLNSVNKILFANRGAALKALGKYEEAINDLSKSIEIDQEYLKAYVRRAQCFMELARYEEAERDYSMANLKDPKDKNIKQNLAEAKRLRKVASRKDYYKILGVDKNFSERELTQAYRKRCLESHPDRKKEEEREEAEKVFKEVQEAYEVLKDPRKRQAYDQGADLEEINGNTGFNPYGGGVDMSEIFSSFGGRSGFRSQGFHFG